MAAVCGFLSTSPFQPVQRLRDRVDVQLSHASSGAPDGENTGSIVLVMESSLRLALFRFPPTLRRGLIPRARLAHGDLLRLQRHAGMRRMTIDERGAGVMTDPFPITVSPPSTEALE